MTQNSVLEMNNLLTSYAHRAAEKHSGDSETTFVKAIMLYYQTVQTPSHYQWLIVDSFTV